METKAFHAFCDVILFLKAGKSCDFYMDKLEELLECAPVIRKTIITYLGNREYQNEH